jgi:hypothetical protein
MKERRSIEKVEKAGKNATKVIATLATIAFAKYLAIITMNQLSLKQKVAIITSNKTQ